VKSQNNRPIFVPYWDKASHNGREAALFPEIKTYKKILSSFYPVWHGSFSCASGKSASSGFTPDFSYVLVFPLNSCLTSLGVFRFLIFSNPSNRFKT
jgi:hypothetical protein